MHTKNPNGYIYSTFMPALPQTQCAQYQCKEPSVKGSVYCVNHAPAQKTTLERKAFNAQYQSSTWHTIRSRQLSIQPLCQACLSDGRITSANHVDHVFPWAAIGKHAFINNKFQSLCESHHGFKSGLEKKGIFRHYGETVTDYGVNDYPYAVNGNASQE